MSDVSNNGIILHFSHIRSMDDVFVSSSCNENINQMNNLFEFDNFITLHASLKCTDWIDFSDINSSSSIFHSTGASFSDISITEDQNLLSRKHNISSSVNSIWKWMFTSINIVEFGFSDWIIDVNSWEWKSLLIFELVESVDSSCCLFWNTNKIFWYFGEELWILS